ncbi:hypothetical protein OG612_32705 [Streptomyces sp. NBC_01527]|uniref:hypothetical protein n=1 Tax=unclassified Streptomyces TaxID=2593676 RepID=UPI002E1162D3|nr:hypothetical protein OG763_10660 [Streptomyces sp. NBC_01230]
MRIARASTMLGVSMAGGAMCMLLSGCYSLAAAIHDPPMPPGTPQAVADEQLVGAWRDEESGSVTFAADGTFVAKDICGDFWDWSGQLSDPVDFHSRSGSGSWKSFTWTPPDESKPVTEVTIRFSDSKVSAQYTAGGTAGSVKLWVYMGDLDNYDLCVASRSSASSTTAD